MNLDQSLKHLNSDLEASGLLFDFDGVLTPIQKDPKTSRILSKSAAELSRLKSQLGILAVISARPISFLQGAIGDTDGIAIFGGYGLQKQLAGGQQVDHPDLPLFTGALKTAASRARAKFPTLYVEEKDNIGISIHFRSEPQLESQVLSWTEKNATELGLKPQAGKMVAELKPPISFDKGDAVREVVGRLSTAWYFGDDKGDTPAFDEITLQRDRREDFDGVKVGVVGVDDVPEIRQSADYLVESPQKLYVLLRSIGLGA